MNIFLNNLFLILFIDLFIINFNSKNFTKFHLNFYKSYIITNLFQIDNLNKINGLVNEIHQKGFLDLGPSFFPPLSDISKKHLIDLPLKKTSVLEMPSYLKSGWLENTTFYPKKILKVKNEIFIKSYSTKSE